MNEVSNEYKQGYADGYKAGIESGTAKKAFAPKASQESLQGIDVTLAALQGLLNTGTFSPWEEQFVTDMGKKKIEWLSAKQVEIINKIHGQKCVAQESQENADNIPF